MSQDKHRHAQRFKKHLATVTVSYFRSFSDTELIKTALKQSMDTLIQENSIILLFKQEPVYARSMSALQDGDTGDAWTERANR